MSNPKRLLIAPHLFLLNEVALIIQFDLKTGLPLQGSRGIDGHDKFKDVVSLVKKIPTLDLHSEPDKVTEIQLTGAKILDGLKSSRLCASHFLSQLTEHMVDASNELAHNNHTQQNGGAGEHTGPGNKTARRTPAGAAQQQ